MQKLSSPKIQIIHRNGRSVSTPVKKAGSFFGLFAPTGAEGRAKATRAVLKEPLVKGVPPRVPKVDPDLVKSWVGLEEKIVHDYKEQKSAFFKHRPLLSQTPLKPKPFVPAFETFSTQTTFSLSSSVPKLKEAVRLPKKTSRGTGRSFSVLVGLAVCALGLVYVQGILSSREASRQLVQLQDEKKQLEQTYAALKNVSASQTAEMQGLNSQLRDRAAELKTVEEQSNVFNQNLEKKYRGELMRLTVQYETQLKALREAVQTRDAIVNALRAQIQAFEKIMDPARIAAVSGGAAGFSRRPFSGTGMSALQGSILSVNGRQGFVVVNLGSDQGARSGRGVIISRNGVELTSGRIDRVYPSMSAVLVRDEEILSRLQEGDGISFFQ